LNPRRFIAAVFLILILGAAIASLYWDMKRTQSLHAKKNESYVKISYIDRESDEGFVRADVGDAEIHIPFAYKPSSVTTKHVTFHVRWVPGGKVSKTITPLDIQSSDGDFAIGVVVNFSQYDISHDEWLEQQHTRTNRIFKPHLESRNSQEFKNITEFVAKSNGNTAYHVLKLDDQPYAPNNIASCGSGAGECLVRISFSKYYSVRFSFQKEVLHNYAEFIHDMSSFTENLLLNAKNREKK